MARIYAKLKTAIWGDDEYRALTADAQWLYQYLFSSPKIDICGVTDWNPRKIAAKAADMTVPRVNKAAKILQDARFIVVDEDTEEALVRSFIRHDESLKGPKTAKGVANAWADASSDRIRTVVAVECVRIRHEHPGWSGVSEVNQKMIEKASRYQAHTLSTPYAEGMPEVSVEHQGTLLDPPADTPPIGGGYPIDPLSETDPILLMANGYQPPTKGAPASAELTLAADQSNAGHLVSEWLDGCKQRPPSRVIGQASKLIKEMIDEGIPADTIRAGIERWQAKGSSPSALPGFVNEAANATPQAARTQQGRSGQLSTDQWQAAFQRAQARDQETA